MNIIFIGRHVVTGISHGPPVLEITSTTWDSQLTRVHSSYYQTTTHDASLAHNIIFNSFVGRQEFNWLIDSNTLSFNPSRNHHHDLESMMLHIHSKTRMHTCNHNQQDLICIQCHTLYCQSHPNKYWKKLEKGHVQVALIKDFGLPVYIQYLGFNY